MNNSFSYYKWFRKVMSAFINVFFAVAPLASLYAFTSFLSGWWRIVLFLLAIVAYIAILWFFKDGIRDLIDHLIDRASDLDEKKMILIFSITLLVMKVLFTIFFNYDATKSGDIKIYNDIAEHILSSGDIHSAAISHLYGLALHFVVIRLLGLPLHVGLFIVIYIGILVNFLSFRKIIGKEKAFLVTMLYALMPSTTFFSFSPTHEVFVFMYVSVFLYLFNRLIEENNTGLMVLYVLIMTLIAVLTCFVNPGGYILFIIMVLAILLSNITLLKKGLIVVILVASLLGSNGLSRFLNVNEYSTTINTYTILIHGVNPNSLGEQEDGYPLRQMRKYIYENTLDFSDEGFVDAAKHVLIEHYVYLITHPDVLFRIIIHKTYILWSGVFYPIELARYYDAIGPIPYYIFLVLNTLIYLSVISIGLVYGKEKDDAIEVSNYKLEFLGVIALTMFCIVVNKYSVYVTMFIYMIAFDRMRQRQ